MTDSVAHSAHDPGGRVRTAMPFGMKGWALMSECGVYRHALGRLWSGTYEDDFVLFIGMNPSTADAEVNDPTISREVGFARDWGFGRLIKCNVGDYRATEPASLPETGACSAENIRTIFAYAAQASLIVMAHGVLPRVLRDDGRQITKGLLGLGYKLWCFGTTKHGWPKHPLYLRNNTELVLYKHFP